MGYRDKATGTRGVITRGIAFVAWIGLLALAAATPTGGAPANDTPAFRPHAAESLAVGDCTHSGCHAGIAKGVAVHAPAGDGLCDACHEVKPGVKPRFTGGDADRTCAQCHDVAEQAASLATPHPPVAEGCLTCHRPHAGPVKGLLRDPQPELCTTCHEREPLAVHVIAGLRAGQGHPLAGPEDPSRKGETFRCTSCHEPHGSTGPHLFRWKAKEPFDLCGHCHDYAGGSAR